MQLDELETDPKLTVARMKMLHQRHRDDRNYCRTLAEAVTSGSRALERAGAWLLRREAAERRGFPAEDWTVVLDALRGVHSWEGRLILCQMLSEQPQLMDSAPDEVAVFLRDCTRDAEPTTRAWSVNAFHELARRRPAFRAEARQMVAAARRDPAKCMQARLRHLADRKSPRAGGKGVKRVSQAGRAENG